MSELGRNLAKALVVIYGLSPHGSTCPVCGNRAGGPDCPCCRGWGSTDQKGYARCNFGPIRHDAKGRSLGRSTIRAHRWVMEQFIDAELPRPVFVMHLCDNRACIRIEHLTLGTIGDNFRDMVAKGRNGYGGPAGVRKGDDDPCPAGHTGEFSHRVDNARRCLACHRERERERKRRIRS